MNDQLEKLLGLLKGSGGGAKAIAALVAVALVGIVGVGAFVSRTPDFAMGFSNLLGPELGRVTKALSDAGIEFRVSQPPGPFEVFVDEGDRSRAYQAAYGAGALDKPLRGIMSESNLSNVFSSAEERMQGVRKREWEEMEKMLEALDFVTSAGVRTSPGPSSAIAARNAPPMTASVTLRVAGNGRLTDDQAHTVANLVGRGLGVASENLIISDQSGASVFDGSSELDDGQTMKDFLAHQREYDQDMTRLANTVLGDILGENKARVTVSSEWDYAQTSSRIQTPMGTGAVVTESSMKSERPITNNRNVVGVTANTVEDPEAAAAAPEPALETTSEERKQFLPTISAEEKVRLLPQLERLSIALFLDESIDANRVTDLEEAVKASIGYVETRDDFSSVVLPFAVAEEATVADGAGTTPEESGAPSAMTEILLRRGVEIVSALVFIIVLLKSLRSPKKTEAELTPREKTSTEPDVDPELLARAQVEELLRSDPDRVGSILTKWVHDEEMAKAG